MNEYDVFENDLLFDEENHAYPTVGRWGMILLHVIKGAFVLYSGAHNIQASLLATGDNLFAVVAQIAGILVLEVTITALYMAGMAGQITGQLQSVIAAFFWLVGIVMASAGIIADSRLHAGYELGDLLSWYLSTGLFLAPVVMVVGAVLVVFTNPVLAQQIANSRDRATIKRQKVHGTLLAEKAAHESRRIVHNIRLGAQRQMAIEARRYYKSPEVQAVLQETAVSALQDVLRQAGIDVKPPAQALPSNIPADPPRSPTHNAVDAHPGETADGHRPGSNTSGN